MEEKKRRAEAEATAAGALPSLSPLVRVSAAVYCAYTRCFPRTLTSSPGAGAEAGHKAAEKLAREAQAKEEAAAAAARTLG